MLTHSEGLWRIEYHPDLSWSNEYALPIGFMLEAHWSNDVRWLGILFRRRLTALELERVDLETWAELKELEPFMNGLFETAWTEDLGKPGQVPLLGSSVVAKNYPMHSSLQFAADKPGVKLSPSDPEESFSALYTKLLGLHSALTPKLAAPVVQLPKKKLLPARRPAAPRADVEQILRAA